MAGVAPRYIPALPWFSNFPELNLRTYVVRDGKPGVWFFSLDAANPFAVRAARIGFNLPYFDATMSCAVHDETILYSSYRTHRGAPPASFKGAYRPISPPYLSSPGTLEHWLTERYALYAANSKGRLFCGEIHHAPWPLQGAEVTVEKNTMTEQIGMTLPQSEPILHFAKRLDVVAWGIRACGGRSMVS
jgi:hypothetical protein